jgi:hypothetical protein
MTKINNKKIVNHCNFITFHNKYDPIKFWVILTSALKIDGVLVLGTVVFVRWVVCFPLTSSHVLLLFLRWCLCFICSFLFFVFFSSCMSFVSTSSTPLIFFFLYLTSSFLFNIYIFPFQKKKIHVNLFK